MSLVIGFTLPSLLKALVYVRRPPARMHARTHARTHADVRTLRHTQARAILLSGSEPVLLRLADWGLGHAGEGVPSLQGNRRRSNQVAYRCVRH